MNPALRLRLLAFLERIKAMPQTTAHCACGRFYRLMFDVDVTQEVAMLEALIEVEPTPGRFTYLEHK